MKADSVSTFWQLHDDGIVCSFRVVVLGDFRAQTPHLHPHQRIQMWVEVSRPAEDLCSDLIFLQRKSRVFDGVIGQIPKKFAERFRAVEYVAVD